MTLRDRKPKPPRSGIHWHTKLYSPAMLTNESPSRCGLSGRAGCGRSHGFDVPPFDAAPHGDYFWNPCFFIGEDQERRP